MDRDILFLSAALGILSLGILALGADLLAGSRRRAVVTAVPPDELRALLRVAPPMKPQAVPESASPEADHFVFRRHAARDLAPAAPPDAAAIQSDIRNEIRAALEASAPPVPPPASQAPQLSWTEPDRLAVLSLTGTAPEAGLALLRAHGIATLIAAQDHPFPPTFEGVELLILPDGAEAAAPLAARLREQLAAGGRIAFHTETGLNGAAALLAARFSSRRAG